MPATPQPEGTARVTQLWPIELKEQVRAAAGDRGMSEFTIDAVTQHLGLGPNLTDVQTQLNEVKHFAQLLADQVVLGIESPEERIQALMELEFPSWISTEGWPQVYADRVRPEVREADPAEVAEDAERKPRLVPPAQDPVVAETVPEVEWVQPEHTPELIAEAQKVADRYGIERLTPTLTEEQAESIKDAPPGPVFDPGRDDLFARMMAKTGGALDDVPGLKVASQIEAPTKPDCDVTDPHDDHETSTVRCPGVGPNPDQIRTDAWATAERTGTPATALCPNCGDEMVDGECWTCD